MKRFWVLSALFVFANVGQCAGKKGTTSKKVARTVKANATKAKGTVKRVGPPFGLYEVKVFNTELVPSGENDSYFADFYWLEHDFKWLRLYKNGTYKTNLSKSGKPEGRFSYDHKKQEVTFYEFRPKQKNHEHLIYHKEPAHYGNDFVAFQKGNCIIWYHEHYTAVRGGYVVCKWVKP